MTNDTERMRIAPHLNQILRDLRDMTAKIRNMTDTIVTDRQQIVERTEYFGADGYPVREAITELKKGLDALNAALDELAKKM